LPALCAAADVWPEEHVTHRPTFQPVRTSESPEAVAVRPLGDRRYLVTLPDGTQRVALAARGAGGSWVFLRGRTFFIPDAAASPARSAARDDGAALAAPMPATVVAVNVEPGASVKHGDVLVVLEAMKMELPIKAPRDGRVRRILCRAGELVQPGSPLLELD
jgi:acetyl-CoA/propionyl-CoA carboxylase, biotin carboxylase, biotin carboxyl carrier protein